MKKNKEQRSNLKVCQICHSFLPVIGGAEIAVHNIAKNLTQLGVNVSVLTSRGYKQNSIHSNYPIHYYYRTPKGSFQGIVLLARLLILQKKYRFDLIHVHKAQRAFYVLKIKNLLKVPIIITTHGGDIQLYPEINYGDRLNPKWKDKIEYAIKNADIVTAIGKSTRNHYSTLGVAENRIVDIPNGVDTDRFNSPTNNLKNILGIPENHLLLLSVGRYHIKKGYEYLLKSLPTVSRSFTNFKLLIVGRNLNVLKPLIKNLGIESFVILSDEQSFNSHSDFSLNFDQLPNDFLLSAYKSSDIYISSSLIEGFALTLVEAMAASLPVIATNVEGNEDAVVHDKNGILIPPKDHLKMAQAIIELIKNPDLRKRYGKKSNYFSTAYDWRLITGKYLTTYLNLTG